MRRLLLIAIVCSGCSLDAEGIAELSADDDAARFDEGAGDDTSEAIDGAVEDSGTSTPDTSDDTFVADTSVPDTFVRDTFVPDTFVRDTFVPDTFVRDTFVPDTFVPDTFVRDTFVPDTFVPDTFVADTRPSDTGGDAVTVDATTCTDPGAVIYGGHCYFPLTNVRSWIGSRDTCALRNAHLVTISNAAEQAAVATVGTGERWIGLLRVSGVSYWFNGDPSTYRNWLTGEPNGSGECARMIAGGTWRDTPCTDPFTAICERDSL